MSDFLNELVTKIRELGEKYPFATYQKPDECTTCRYDIGHVENGPNSCGCIVGQAMREVSPENYERIASKEISFTYLSRCVLELGPCIQTIWIQSVQNAQDAGLSWGAAIKQANENYEFGVE